MRRRALLAALPPLLLGGCGLFRRRPPPSPAANAHYTVGDGYELAGVWYYPSEHTDYDESALATLAPDRAGLTADGEVFSQAVLAASHHTLQLPSIARVTNLQNGRSLLLRLNDRGPANPGRLIGLTRHAADLLGAQDGTQVRVQLDPAMTQALADQLGGGPKLALTAAPLDVVQSEALPPPPGLSQSSRVRSAVVPTRAVPATVAAAAVPARLPDQVEQGPALPGDIYLQASEFGRSDYARRLAAHLSGIGARVERLRDGRTERYRVVAGPFISVAAADDALDLALRAGVIDSRLVVRGE